MSTTRDDIREWFVRGKTAGNSRLIVVCDTFDHEDYPVYVKSDSDFRTTYNHYNGPNMQRVMEVYDLNGNMEEQLKEHRTFRMP